MLAGALAAVGAGLAAGPAAAQAAPRTEVLPRARAFAALLSPTQREFASFPFGGRVHRGWNYFGARAKPGLRLEQMRADKASAAMDLLSALLSPAGLAKFDRVRVLQDVLRERGAGPADRNAGRFSFALFGEPSDTDPWGLRVEGHHLSLSFTMMGPEVVSVTPSSFSSNPNEVRGGRHDGLVALREEHEDAARLMRDLSASNAARARVFDRPFGNILATAGREGRLFGAPREGVPLVDLHPAQRDLAMRIVDAYAVDHLAGPLAAEQAARVRMGDPGAIHLAWGGGTAVGDLMYYRLHGDSFVIELATNPPEPLHLHTIRHDPERHLGRHAV